jgi:hypothetical protein
VADAWTITDKWSDTLDDLAGKFGPVERKRQMAEVGLKMVARLKRFHGRKGFGNEKPYKPLKGKWRYHGRKTLVGGSVVNKTKITKSSKPLVDSRNFKRSWQVLDLKSGEINIGCDTEKYRKLAYIHGDTESARTVMPERGNWNWGKRPADLAHRAYLKKFDKDIFN